MNAWQRLSSATAACVTLASCVQAGPVPEDSHASDPASRFAQAPSAQANAPLDRAWAEVIRLRGDAACSADTQCHSIGVGSKSCGGPSGYLAWSSAQTDGAVLAVVVQQHADIARAAHQASGRASNCAVEPDPGAVCKAAGNDTRCELQER